MFQNQQPKFLPMLLVVAVLFLNYCMTVSGQSPGGTQKREQQKTMSSKTGDESSVYKSYFTLRGSFRICEFSADSNTLVAIPVEKENHAIRNSISRHIDFMKKSRTLSFVELTKKNTRQVTPHQYNECHLLGITGSSSQGVQLVGAKGRWGIQDFLSSRSSTPIVSMNIPSNFLKNEKNPMHGSRINWTRADGRGWKIDKAKTIAQAENGEVRETRFISGVSAMMVLYRKTDHYGRAERSLGVYPIGSLKRASVVRIPEKTDRSFLSKSFLDPKTNSLMWVTAGGILNKLSLKKFNRGQNLYQKKLRVAFQDTWKAGGRFDQTFLGGCSRSGKFVTFDHQKGNCIVWTANGEISHRTSALPLKPVAATYLNENNVILVSDNRGNLYQIVGSTKPKKIASLRQSIRSISVSPDKQYLALRLANQVNILKLSKHK